MGGSASSPNYAKIKVDVVNQESGEGGVSRLDLVLPVDAGVFDAVEGYTDPSKYGDEDVIAFVKNAEKMREVAKYFIADYAVAYGVVMDGIMDDNYAEHVAANNVGMIFDMTGGVAKIVQHEPVTEILTGSLIWKTSLTLPFALMIIEDGGGSHANTGVVKYNAGTQDLLVLLFEPHATGQGYNKMVIRVLTYLMTSVIEKVSSEITLPPVSVRVVSPHSGLGLQGGDPLCVAWSILMLLVYLLNCEVGRERRCSFGRVQGVMETLWHRRRHIMPAWLYTLRKYVPEHVPRHTRRVQRIHTGEIFDTAFDAAQCNGRDPGDCTHPCALDSGTGTCYNTKIFKR